MKTKVCLLMTAVLLLMTLLPGCSAGTPTNTTNSNGQVQTGEGTAVTNPSATSLPGDTTSPNPNAEKITQAEAREIALKHAGFTADQVERLRTEYEIDDRVPQYDVEFHVNGMEYEFEIHAETGEILSYDRDTD